MEYLFLWSTQDWEEFYLYRGGLVDWRCLFILYTCSRVYDIDTSLQSCIEDDELLADLEDTYWHLLTGEYINNKYDLLIRHYFHSLSGLDNIYFWDRPDRECQLRIKEWDIYVLMWRIQNICWVRTDDDWDEWTDFTDDNALYDDIYNFIKEAFASDNTEKKEEIKDVVYKHI